MGYCTTSVTAVVREAPDADYASAAACAERSVAMAEEADDRTAHGEVVVDDQHTRRLGELRHVR